MELTLSSISNKFVNAVLYVLTLGAVLPPASSAVPAAPRYLSRVRGFDSDMVFEEFKRALGRLPRNKEYRAMLEQAETTEEYQSSLSRVETRLRSIQEKVDSL